MYACETKLDNMYSLGMLSVLTVGVLLPFGYPFLLSNSIEVWVTNDRGPDKLTGKSPIMPSSSASGFNITVDRNKRYQSILGFGASITSSSAWNIYHSRARDAIMEYLFNRNYDKDGIGKKFPAILYTKIQNRRLSAVVTERQ